MVALLSLFSIKCCDKDEYIDYKYDKENCFLTEVPSDIPAGAKEVYLGENEITNVSSQTFFNLTQCTWLSMNDNKLTHVHVGMFDRLTSLEDLILKRNDIKRIDGGAFSYLTKCTWLDLAQNKLTDLTSNTFDGLLSLEGLELNGNKH